MFWYFSPFFPRYEFSCNQIQAKQTRLEVGLYTGIKSEEKSGFFRYVGVFTNVFAFKNYMDSMNQLIGWLIGWFEEHGRWYTYIEQQEWWDTWHFFPRRFSSQWFYASWLEIRTPTYSFSFLISFFFDKLSQNFDSNHNWALSIEDHMYVALKGLSHQILVGPYFGLHGWIWPKKGTSTRIKIFEPHSFPSKLSVFLLKKTTFFWEESHSF